MATKALVTLTSDASSATLAQKLVEAGKAAESCEKLENYIQACKSGADACTLELETAMVQASGTITFSGVGAALDTILINGVTFTARASGATGNEWNVGASATLSAAALAAAINASATALVNGHVSAASALGVVTITAKVPGVAGNAVTIAEGVDSTAAMTVSGARLTGGTSTKATFALHR